MTSEEIADLKAGRETDALIGRELFGLDVEKVEHGPIYTKGREWVEDGDYVINDPGSSLCEELPRYTESIRAAFQVLQKWDIAGRDIELRNAVRGWICTIDQKYVGKDISIPMAIWRAAFRAKAGEA